MLRAIADTHTLIWYLFRDNRLSKAAGAAIEEAAAAGDQVGFSSVSLAEIIYLIEKGRINAATLDRLLTAIDQKDAVLAEVPFDRHIALPSEQWTNPKCRTFRIELSPPQPFISSCR